MEANPRETTLGSPELIWEIFLIMKRCIAISPEGTGTLRGDCVHMMSVWIWKAGSKTPLFVFIDFAEWPKRTNGRGAISSPKTQLLPAGWLTSPVTTPRLRFRREDKGRSVWGPKLRCQERRRVTEGCQVWKAEKDLRSPRQIRQTLFTGPQPGGRQLPVNTQVHARAPWPTDRCTQAGWQRQRPWP